MKKIILACLCFGILFVSCELGEKQTKEECLSGFFGKAQSSNYAAMKDYIHPDNTNIVSMDSNFFSNEFEGPNVLYNIAIKNGNTYTVSVVYPTTGTRSETYIFQEHGDGYFMIRTFTGTNGTW